MARRSRSSTLAVYLNGRQVGRLSRTASGAIDFLYAPEWLAWKHTLPISLSLPLREDRYAGAAVNAVFDNLLPDNDNVRRRVAARLGAHGMDPYSLLAAVGRDCVGALQFLPGDEAPGPVGRIDAEPVDEAEIAAIIADLATAPLGLHAEDDFRISIAGMQEKTALLWWEGSWHRPLGTTPTTHIFKPQIGRLPNGIDLSNSVENEWFCLQLLSELGLPVAKSEMATFGNRRVLIVERFDRQLVSDGRLLRRPQEDMCQALSIPSVLKYEIDGGPGVVDIMKLLASSDTPDVDQRRFFEAVVAFWLLGATDGHAKNFSVFMSPGGRFKTTPLYDVLSAQPSLDDRQIETKQMRLAMAAGDRRRFRIDEISPRHFLQTAAKAGFAERLGREVLDGLRTRGESAVERLLAGLPSDFPAAVSDGIARGFLTRLRMLDGAE